MEKVWPPLKECPQYKCGMINQFLEKTDWEDAIGDGDETLYWDSSDSDEEGGVIQYKYKPSEVQKFLHQVRTSRAYDLDVRTPSCFYCYLEPVKTEDISNEIYQLLLKNSIGLIIPHINSMTNKEYTYVKTLRLVDSVIRILLLTFTAKEKREDAVEETFYAAVSIAAHIEEYELLECFPKPDGPAPES